MIQKTRSALKSLIVWLVARNSDVLCVAPCWWHEEKTPSMLKYKDGYCHCLSCGTSGYAPGWVCDRNREAV